MWDGVWCLRTHFDARAAAVQKPLLLLKSNNLKVVLGRTLGNAMAHKPETDASDTLKLRDWGEMSE